MVTEHWLCIIQKIPTGHLVKAMVFPVVMYGCESCTIKKAFELWCWRRLLWVPWTARRSNQSILKEISPDYSLEGLMLKLKLQNFGLMQRTDSSWWKRPWCWERLKAGWDGDNRRWDDWMASPTWIKKMFFTTTLQITECWLYLTNEEFAHQKLHFFVERI